MRFFAWSIDLVMSFRNLNCHKGKNLTDLSNYIFNYRNGSDLLSDLLLMQICIYQNPISSFPLTCHLRALKRTYDEYYNLISCDLVSSLLFFLLILLLTLKQVKFPVLLRKSSYSRLWFKPDTMFSTPKAYVKIDFNCPYAGNSPEAEVLTDIFTRLLMDCLNEYGKKLKLIRFT